MLASKALHFTVLPALLHYNQHSSLLGHAVLQSIAAGISYEREERNIFHGARLWPMPCLPSFSGQLLCKFLLWGFEAAVLEKKGSVELLHPFRAQGYLQLPDMEGF